MLKYILLLAIVSLLVGCAEEEIGANPACKISDAYTHGIKIIESKLKYPAQAKFPTIKEDPPVRKKFGTCDFSFYIEADIPNGYGALKRSKIFLDYHFDEAAGVWVEDEFLLR